MTADLFAWVGTVCLVTLNLPQVWRTCVQGRTAGVPASRAWVAIAVALIWLGYGLYSEVVVQVVLNTAVILLNVALLIRLATSTASTLRWLGLLGVTGLAVVQLHSLGGAVAVGALGAVTGAGLCLPQLLALRTATDSEGVSGASLALQAMGAGCWLLYGVLRAETVVWTPNVAVLITTAWTIALLQGSRTGRTEPAGVLVS